jgi:hypothetical protein
MSSMAVKFRIAASPSTAGSSLLIYGDVELQCLAQLSFYGVACSSARSKTAIDSLYYLVVSSSVLKNGS